MEYGVIDIGTNSVRLMLCRYDVKLKVLSKKIITTRIGRELQNSGLLPECAIADTLCAIKQLMADASKCMKLYAFATNAVRDAKNGSEFVKRAKDELGLDIEVIDGNLEAKIGFLGAVGQGSGIVIDIGGGSTEIVYGINGEIQNSYSAPMGCVRAKSGYFDNLVGHKQLAKDFLGMELKEVKAEKKAVMDVISQIKAKNIQVYAVGGTATTLCALAAGLTTHYDNRIVHRRILTIGEINTQYEILARKTHEQRKKIKLLEKRGDIILYGAVILRECMKLLNTVNVLVSDSDNLEGYMIYKLGGGIT